jgi:hypothetical protein
MHKRKKNEYLCHTVSAFAHIYIYIYIYIYTFAMLCLLLPLEGLPRMRVGPDQVMLVALKLQRSSKTRVASDSPPYSHTSESIPIILHVYACGVCVCVFASVQPYQRINAHHTANICMYVWCAFIRSNNYDGPSLCMLSVCYIHTHIHHIRNPSMISLRLDKQDRKCTHIAFKYHTHTHT